MGSYLTREVLERYLEGGAAGNLYLEVTWDSWFTLASRVYSHLRPATCVKKSTTRMSQPAILLGNPQNPLDSSSGGLQLLSNSRLAPG